MLLKGLICALLLSSGCFLDGGDDTLPQCNVASADDAVLVASDSDSVISDMLDGGEVPLIAAPQGGHILLVGARVHSANDCQLQATGSLRDPATQRVIGLEQRPLLLEMRSDGWAAPRQGLDAMPNVAVCPTAAATTSIDANPYLLEVALSTLDGAPLMTRTITVTPTCTSSYCHIDCAAPTP